MIPEFKKKKKKKKKTPTLLLLTKIKYQPNIGRKINK
jgi:hypothetical protein